MLVVCGLGLIGSLNLRMMHGYGFTFGTDGAFVLFGMAFAWMVGGITGFGTGYCITIDFGFEVLCVFACD